MMKGLLNWSMDFTSRFTWSKEDTTTQRKQIQDPSELREQPKRNELSGFMPPSSMSPAEGRRENVWRSEIFQAHVGRFFFTGSICDQNSLSL